MCRGIPMQVTRVDAFAALQEVHVGSWLLVAGQTAHAVLDEHEAHEITALLQELGQLDQL